MGAWLPRVEGSSQVRPAQPIDLHRTSFFLSREVVVPTLTPGMPAWRKRHFFGMLRNAQSATEFFRIPSNLVVELATPPWNYDGNGRDRGRD